MKSKKVIRILIAIIVVCMLADGSILSLAATKKTKELKIKYDKLTIYTGDSKTLGIVKNTTGSKATFKSSNILVATVSGKGVIKAKKEGSVTITVNSGTKTARCKVTVKTKVIQPTELIFENDGYIVLSQGETYECGVTVVPNNAVNKTVTYTSSDTSIVTVDANGFFTGHNEGNATVTAKASNGITAECDVDVTYRIYEAPIIKKIPEDRGSTLYLKQGAVNLGETVSEVEATFGPANRIDDNEYGGQTHVYNSDYSSLLFVYVENEVVVGYFTNAATFSSAGISNTSSIEEVREVSCHTGIWTVPDKYRAEVWYDYLGNKKTMALFLTIPTIDHERGADNYLHNPNDQLINNMGLEAFDLVNGYRGREGIAPFILNTTVASVSRSHSQDMVDRNYSSHISPEGVPPGRRILNAGILWSGSGEIICTYPISGIIVGVSAFMNSDGHRDVIRSSSHQYAGAGIAYGEENASLTINFYY